MFKQLSQQLRDLQAVKNNGVGIPQIKQLCVLLEQENLIQAEEHALTHWHRFEQFTDICQLLIENGIVVK
jgi:hypothetical protein